MPISEAVRRLPPETVYVRPSMVRYARVSRQIMGVLETISPLVEKVSIDEAFLDVSGLERLVGPPEVIGQRAKAAIREAVDLTASVGIGPNRLIAKHDHALLALLYNTGACIQEAPSLCPNNAWLDSPAHVKLYGKGRKERICPLWSETAELLAALRKRQPRPDQEPLFVNRYGRPLGAAGVRYKLAEYVRAAAKELPSPRQKRVSPHRFRHYSESRTMPSSA
jgi:integrase